MNLTKHITVGLVLLSASTYCLADLVYWTFRPSAGDGILTTVDGKVAYFAPNAVPTGPSTAGLTWVPCKGNFIYFSQTITGENIPKNIVNSVLANLMFAQANVKMMRIGIDRKTNDECYGSQVFYVN